MGQSENTSVYRVQANTGTFVIKTSNQADSIALTAEYNGLQKIAQTQTISTPEIYAFNTWDNKHYILMQYIEEGGKSRSALSQLGHDLAALHNIQASTFGLDVDNFIGSLPQSNKQHLSWAQFYYHERLYPQLKKAFDLGFLETRSIKNEHHWVTRIENLIDNVTPVLLHGDLWAGNCILNKKGSGTVIDPAVYYGHNEVDIAMSLLFGGFDETFYDAYFSEIGRVPGLQDRILLYQLYYLLVHLNLFGMSYQRKVSDILHRFS